MREKILQVKTFGTFSMIYDGKSVLEKWYVGHFFFGDYRERARACFHNGEHVVESLVIRVEHESVLFGDVLLPVYLDMDIPGCICPVIDVF